MISTDQIPDLRTAAACDRDGQKFGSVGDIYLDDDTGLPSWVTVNTGMFGTSQSFAPLHGAELDDGDLRLPYPQNLVRNAPPVEAPDHLGAEDEHRLQVHYGLAEPHRDDAAEDGAD